MDSEGSQRKNRSYHPIRKIRIGMTGMRHAVLLDFSVRYKFAISVPALLIAATFESLFHFVFMLTVTSLMLVTEILNTAIEGICDYIQPNIDVRIKNIKDVAAAAAMIAITVWMIDLIIVFYEFATSTEVFGKLAILKK